MNLDKSMERLGQAAQDTLPVEQPAENLENPPAFGRRESAEGTGDAPPKIEREDPAELTLGESVEHYCARHQLASDIKNGRRIATENSLKKLAEIEAKEASK